MNISTTSSVCRSFAALLLIVLCFAAASVSAQTTTFTYQGRLTDSGMTSGTYDLQFSLYDETGAPIGMITRDDVPVTNGVFTVQLDFGAAAFPGADRTLEIAVRRGAEAGAYTTLTPRQPITSTPYAIRARSAGTADTASTATTAMTATNAQQLGGAVASNFVQTNSTAFVRNQTTQQTSANFNIDGTGKANIFDATTQYNIGGSRVLSVGGQANLANLFAGVGTATTGFNNSFVGASAGQANTGGHNNSFVGFSAGFSNTTGIYNSFVGVQAGYSNTTGNYNSFVGRSAGLLNTTGGNNAFFGAGAGVTNATGSNNTALGQNADVGSGALTFATALGSGAVVSSNDTVVLGRTSGTVIAPNLLKINTLGAVGGVHLCRNAANEVSTCSETPIVVFAAEKSDSLMDATTKILNEQKAQIERQQREINELKMIVCSLKPEAAICKEK